MQSRIEAFDQAGADVIAISSDSVEQNATLTERHGIEFAVLSDPDLEAIDAFGLRHVGGGFEGDIARPAVFIVDETGRIVWRSLTDNWRIRSRPEHLLGELLRSTGTDAQPQSSGG